MSVKFLFRYLLCSVTLFTGLHLLAQQPEEFQPRDALVKVATACMRAMPAHSSEMVSQVVMGTPLRLIEKEENWWKVESPEGYQGYVIENGIHPLDSIQARDWRSSHRLMYTAPYTGRIMRLDGGRYPVSDIHAGSVLVIVNDRHPDSVVVRLPDGRLGRLSKTDTQELTSLISNPINALEIIDMAKNLMGVAYLWGGTTTAGMDCSGLVKICYLNQGLILPRDASQQALVGEWLGEDYHNYRRGDLVFFKSATTGNIVHVGIYDENGWYVHSSGRVRINSLDPNSTAYIPSNILAGGCRVIGHECEDGINRLNQSRAYFNIP